MKRLFSSLVAFGLVAFLLAFAGTANAQKVANPGTVNFKITSGSMQVKSQVFEFDESQNINFNGTVNAAGNINIPTIAFPEYPISASGFNLTVKINVVGPTTGTINPLNGAISLRLKVWIKIDGVPLGGGCRIASADSPVDVNALITGTSGSKTGSPYNSTSGTAKIVNASFAVPGSSSCGIAAGTVDDTVGIPSAAGNNSAEFNIKTTPNLNRAIVPALTASPSSGTAPFATTLSAAGSSVIAGPATYRWDFTNDGTIDQTTSTPTVNHTYTVGGTPSARVQVVDADGDIAETTRQVTVNAYPDLGIGVSHDSDFRVGSIGRYKIALQNHGYAATSGPVTVTSTLPAGLSYSGVSGTGWTCSASGQDLACSRTASVAVGANAPDLNLDLAVAAPAFNEVEPTFTVNAVGDNGPGNNTATDLTRVRATDLKLSLSHPAHAMLLGTGPDNVVRMSAENIGDADTVGATVIINEVPAGLTPLSAAGPGWDCEIDGQKVTCTHSGQIVAGSSTGVVEVAVSAALEAGQLGVTVNNSATLTTADDIDPASNEVTDPTLILDGQDVGVVKSHEDTFTAGQNEQYRLAVKNFGTHPTTGPTTVSDTLPAGLEFVAADGGPNWECSEEDGTVSCVHADPIAAGADAADIELTVSVGVEAIPEVTNTATVATPDDPNPANDSSADTAVVQAIDLTIVKSHEGLIRVGQQATYQLDVQNVGDSPTVGRATVTDILPTGLSFVSADGGPDWECVEAADTVNCEYAGILEANQHAPTIELTTMVGPAAAPEVENTASVATEDDFNSANNASADSATVIDVDTSVSISRTGTFRPAQNGTYLVVVRNEGTVATAHPTEVAVELPAGLGFTSINAPGWACTEDDGLVSCSRPAGLAAETTAPAISLRVLVGPSAVPGVETTATATTEGDRYPDNDSDVDSATVAAPDLVVNSSHEGVFRVTGNHSYFLEVTNQGSGKTTGMINLTNTLPAGFTASASQGSGWSCEINTPTVSCERSAALAPGDSASPVRLDVSPTAAALPAGENAATVENAVEVSTDVESNTTNNGSLDPTDLTAVDIAVQASGPDDLPAGQVAEYEVSVENLGSAATDGVVRVVDILPTGFSPRPSTGEDWTCSSAGQKVTCDYSRPVGAGETLPSLTIRGRAGNEAVGAASNNIKISTPGDINATNDSADVETEVTAAADLELKVKANSPGGKLMVGSDSGYTGQVTNLGTAATSGAVTVVFNLPPGISFLSQESGSGWSCSTVGTAVNCVHGASIPAGSSTEFSFLTKIANSAPGALSVAASLTGGADTNPENNTAVTVDQIGRLDVALSRSHSPSWVRGDTGSYQLTVENVGSTATTGPVKVTETLPEGTTFASANGQGWECQVSQRTLSCGLTEILNPGDRSVLGINLDLGEGVSSTIEASAQVSTAGDSNPSNDTATDEISVGSKPQPSGSGPVVIRKGKVKASQSGQVIVWVSCPSTSANRCAGSLRLKSTGKVKVNRRKKAKVNLGKASFTVAAGRSVPVRVSLAKKGRKALRFNRKVKATVTASNSGGSPSSAKITIGKAR